MKIDENRPNPFHKENSGNKMIKIYNFNLSSVNTYAKPCKLPHSKPVEGYKLFKIEAIPSNLKKSIKIEYSKDNKLLEKLFQMKNMVKIKKKSFI